MLDDSHLSVNSDVNLKRNDEEKKEMNNKLEIIEEETKNYLEDMKKGTYNIMVAVRCRPLWNKEKEFSEYEIVKILDRKMVILMDPYEYNGPNEIFKNRSREQTYAFDFSFDKTCSQQTVFTHTTKFLLDGVANGYNATVFAYGSTGAGKTYTMLGTEDDPGIMPLTLQELFNKVEEYSSERDYKVKLWYLEIYNENIRDLLSNSDDYLDLREDPTKGVSVTNISELNVTSCKDIMQILRRGNKNRTQEATNANETSSRSHAILQVLVEYKEKVTAMEAEIKVGKLSLIDLAGSERASATQNRGIRLIEGANINRSLLTLGNCINALCEASEKGTKPYVPYRDSKLTRLLKDSLGGNSRTVMIANVSPSVTTFDDTYNTLKYANRAKNIKTHVQRNVLNVQYHISNYNNIISNLKTEVADLKLQLAKANGGVYNSNKIYDNNTNLLRKEESKEKDSSIALGSNKLNNSLFEKCVQELKLHCEDEILLKEKIIEQEQEMNNLTAIVKNYQLREIENVNNISNIHAVTLERIDAPLTEENEPLVDDKDDKDLILNETDINNNRIQINTSNRVQSFSIKDKEKRILIMRKSNEVNVQKLKELTSKRESLMNNFYKLGIKDFYFEYLQSILKAHNAKLFIIENKYKEKFNAAISSVKESYILELENQVKLRDEILSRQGLNIYDEEESNLIKRIKTVEQLKNEYKNKLPIIPLNIRESSSKKEGKEMNKMGNLPPITHNNSSNNLTNNINSILSEVKVVNNRLEINNINNPFIKKDRSKIRSELIMNNKANQIRNLSRGVRNINQHMLKENNIIQNNTQTNPGSGNACSNVNNTPIMKNLSNKINNVCKGERSSKNNNMVLITNKKYNKDKDSNSEKSLTYSVNISNENDQDNSDVLDVNNINNISDEDTNLKDLNFNIPPLNKNPLKRNNHFKDNKKILNYNAKEESPVYVSPLVKKEYFYNNNNKFVNNYKRDDSLNNKNNWNDFQPQVKKKDLNVYLNERHEKSKKQKKIPFKI